jgi:hypothetical protein
MLRSRLQSMREGLRGWRSTLRTKGKWHFILNVGVLCWGLPSGVIFSIFQMLVHHRDAFQPGFILLDILLWCASGCLYGITMWDRERKLKRSRR